MYKIRGKQGFSARRSHDTPQNFLNLQPSPASRADIVELRNPKLWNLNQNFLREISILTLEYDNLMRKKCNNGNS